jgi:hypothetical protein
MSDEGQDIYVDPIEAAWAEVKRAVVQYGDARGNEAALAARSEPRVDDEWLAEPVPEPRGERLALVPDHVWRYQQGSKHLAGCCVHPGVAPERQETP